MQNPDISAFEIGGSAKIAEAEIPPIWHRQDASPVFFRSLLHDASEAIEHKHDTIELILNLGTELGSIAWRDSDGRENTLQLYAEDCCFVPAGVTHVVNGLKAHGVVSLLVGGVLMAELARQNLSGVIVENLRRLTAHDAMAGGLVSEFTRLIIRQPHVLLVNTLGFALALKLLHAILSRKYEYGKRLASFTPVERSRTIEFLKTGLAERVQITVVARQLGMSRTHFTRRFKATFGMPPLQFILKMRVDRALELMRDGERRVAEAAYAVGFYDQSHFDRHCRKFYGKSPSDMQRF